MLTEPRTVPLSPSQQRDVQGAMLESQRAQDRLNIIARTVIGGTDIDPDSLVGCKIDLTKPEIGIVITPPTGG